jgi:hypothetical protein
MTSIETIRGRQTRVDQFDGEASAVIARAEAALALIGTERVYETVTLMKADAALLEGDMVRTLGYYAAYDGGGAVYDIVTLATHGATPDGYGDHTTTGGLVAQLNTPANVVKAEWFGVTVGAECSARWQEAFFTAADLAADGVTSPIFSCTTNFLTKNTLWMSDRSFGAVEWVQVYHPGEVKATTGGNLASSVFATSTPMIHFRISKGTVEWGNLDCNRLCSGVLVRGGVATRVYKPNIVRFQRFGYFVCDGIVGESAEGRNGNHVLMHPNIKQWEQTDAEFDEDDVWTGDCLVAGHKDWQCIGGTYGWSRTALLMLDQTLGTGDVDGRTVYCGYKSQGCGDFYARGMHLMQGRPGGPARTDNRDIGGPINIECWSQTNKAYILDTDWDSGTGQFYGHRVVIDGVSVVSGGKNRKDDRVVVFDPICRFYARADATQPAGLEIGQNNNMTIGFLPFEGEVWAGDYEAINYDNRQKSTGYTGDVVYVDEWNAETASVFPTSTTAGEFWLVRTNTSGSTVTFAGQNFTDGDLLTAIVNGASTTIYAANWYVSGNNQVEMLLRGVQGRANAGERYVQATAVGVPILAFMSPADDIKVEYDVGGVKASTNWDGAILQIDGAEIRLKNWAAVTGGDFVPVVDNTQKIGSAALRVNKGFFGALDISASAFGYATGAGGAVTQITSRTTAVTLNKACGQITMFNAAGSTTAASFTVNNTQMTAASTVILSQKSGSNKYILLVTGVNANSFEITFYTTGGTASDTPVINFAIINAVAA